MSIFQSEKPRYESYFHFAFERAEVIPTEELDCYVEGITVGFESIDRLMRYSDILLNDPNASAVTVESVRLGVISELKGMNLYQQVGEETLAFEAASFTTKLGMENAFFDGVKKVWDAIIETIKKVVESILEFLGFSSAKVEATEKQLDKEKKKLNEVVEKAKKAKKDNDKSKDIQVKLIQEDFAYIGREVKAGDILKESEKLIVNEGHITKIFNSTEEVVKKVSEFGIKALDAMKDDPTGSTGSLFMAIGGLFKQGINGTVQSLPAPENLDRYMKAINIQGVVRPWIRSLKGYVRGSELVFYSVPHGESGHQQNFQEVRFIHFADLNDKVNVKFATIAEMEQLISSCEKVNNLYGKAIESSSSKVQAIRSDIKKLTFSIQEVITKARTNKEAAGTDYKGVQGDLVAIKLALKSIKLLMVNLSGSLSAATVTNNAHLNYVLESRKELEKTLEGK